MRRTIGGERVHGHHVVQNTAPKEPTQRSPRFDTVQNVEVESAESERPSEVQDGVESNTAPRRAPRAIHELADYNCRGLREDTETTPSNVLDTPDGAESAPQIVSDGSEQPTRYPTRKRVPTKRLITDM